MLQIADTIISQNLDLLAFHETWFNDVSHKVTDFRLIPDYSLSIVIMKVGLEEALKYFTRMRFNVRRYPRTAFDRKEHRGVPNVLTMIIIAYHNFWGNTMQIWVLIAPKTTCYSDYWKCFP